MMPPMLTRGLAGLLLLLPLAGGAEAQGARPLPGLTRDQATVIEHCEDLGRSAATIDRQRRQGVRYEEARRSIMAWAEATDQSIVRYEEYQAMLARVYRHPTAPATLERQEREMCLLMWHKTVPLPTALLPPLPSGKGR